jgi:hypothetical protein
VYFEYIKGYFEFEGQPTTTKQDHATVENYKIFECVVLGQ